MGLGGMVIRDIVVGSQFLGFRPTAVQASALASAAPRILIASRASGSENNSEHKWQMFV